MYGKCANILCAVSWLILHIYASCVIECQVMNTVALFRRYDREYSNGRPKP